MTAHAHPHRKRKSPPPAGALYVGCAGWSLPRDAQPGFPAEGTHLQRYAARFPAVEINSSFYRPHRPATYARWAAGVPQDFRFSVKMPRAITHQKRLVGTQELLDAFLAETAGLGEKLGCLLVQLPPSLAFKHGAAQTFFTLLRRRYAGPVAAEPRHASWFVDATADELLRDLDIARVAADPPHAPVGGNPGGADTIIYYRLHGSPRVYYSPYDEVALHGIAAALAARRAAGKSAWCIFDNTALGAATANALDVLARLAPGAGDVSRRSSGVAAVLGRKEAHAGV